MHSYVAAGRAAEGDDPKWQDSTFLACTSSRAGQGRKGSLAQCAAPASYAPSLLVSQLPTSISSAAPEPLRIESPNLPKEMLVARG